jgi:AcrR family transcriptional regulator
MTTKEKAPRPIPLSRDRILRAAVAVADRGGFESLSMRNLAQELGTAPMSLYRHVANKDDLLDGMIDIVFSEIEVPSGGGWRVAMRERAMSTRKALRRHPWAIGLMESSSRPGPANLAQHNATLACLRTDAGLSFPMAIHAYSLMDSYIHGFALQEKTLPGDIPAEAEARKEAVTDDNGAFAAEFPYLAELVVELRKANYVFADEFEYGLDLILDGIEQLRERESASAKKEKLEDVRES